MFKGIGKPEANETRYPRVKKRPLPGTILMVAIIAVLASLLYTREPDAGQRMFKGKTLEEWFNQMPDSHRDPGIQILREIGPDSVVFLADQINRRDSSVRAAYVAIWPKLPGFIKSKLTRPKTAAEIRMRAIGTLRAMGPPFTNSDRGLATLIAALRHSDDDVRTRAEGAIGDLGPEAKAAVPALISSVEQCRASTSKSCINGIWALGRIGPAAEPAIPLLESLVNERTGRERVYAAEALIRVGGDTEMAIAALKKALQDQHPQARKEAAEALRKARLPYPVTVNDSY
jgi:hypothetical protein